MLQELRIKNFAIIEDLSLSFSKGLNILSGETGAGKSIIIGALTLLLGGRSSAEMIRPPEEEAIIEALFSVEPHSVISHQLEAWGLAGDESLLLKRVISRTGKSKAFISGSLATIQMLNQLGMELISISGQHEHQILIRADKHVDILDDFGNLVPLRRQVELGYRRYLNVFQRLNDLKRAEKDKEQRKELLHFQIKEIEGAHLKTGEEDQLKEEERVLSNAQKLTETASSSYDSIYQNPDSAIERLRESMGRLKGVVAIDGSTTPMFRTLETTLFQLEDVAHSLREYMQQVNFDQGRLEEIEMRLDEINKLKRKYGGSLEEIIRYREKAEKELEQIELNEEELSKLKKEKQDVEGKLMQQASDLSKRRKRATSLLSTKVERELHSLGMRKTIFKVKLEKEREGEKDSARHGVNLRGFRVTERGLDVAEFLISPNPGEELRSLARIASGGELSRTILALKRIVVRGRESTTLIFDEVDSGIGGATAEVVGIKLKEIARQQQTLCITHLPQIASFADMHQSIYKEVRDGRTVTFVKKLDSAKEREEEIARMLGGTTITAKTREHAREMLRVVQRKHKRQNG
jgi:DNA repair protein RecN (Recombination protein N)